MLDDSPRTQNVKAETLGFRMLLSGCEAVKKYLDGALCFFGK